MAEEFTPRIEHAQLQQAKKLEIGLIGLIFGDATEKPGNIAAAAIVLCFIIFAILLIVPDSPSLPKSQVLTLLGGIISGALGFLFGRHAH